MRVGLWRKLSTKELMLLNCGVGEDSWESPGLQGDPPVQLSHPYMTSGKTIALTRRTFIGKVMSLLFKMLSRLIITFLPRSKHLLISWLQSPCAVILEPQIIKSATVSTVSPSISHEVMGLDTMILVFWMFNSLLNKRRIFETFCSITPSWFMLGIFVLYLNIFICDMNICL